MAGIGQTVQALTDLGDGCVILQLALDIASNSTEIECIRFWVYREAQQFKASSHAHVRWEIPLNVWGKLRHESDSLNENTLASTRNQLE
jgi:hypothetical protein